MDLLAATAITNRVDTASVQLPLLQLLRPLHWHSQHPRQGRNVATEFSVFSCLWCLKWTAVGDAVRAADSLIVIALTAAVRSPSIQIQLAKSFE